MFSPPHWMLGLGCGFFYFGQFMLAVLYRNAAPPGEERTSRWIAITLWAFFLAHVTISVDPAYGPQAVRNLAFVTSSALPFPICLILIHAYLKRRWASTATSAIYMLTMILLMQIFQFFPAKPQFGPVYHRMDVFLPPLFPLLLVVPAAAIDILLSRWRSAKTFRMCFVLGLAFVVFFNGTNWLFSFFLGSRWAANRFFAGHLPLTAFEKFPRVAPTVGVDLATAVSLLIALAVAALASWVALKSGEWLRRLVR